MKKITILLLSFSLLFACQKKTIEPLTNSNVKALRDTGSDDYKSVKSGLFSDTSIWEKKVSGVWVDAHNTPGIANSVWLEAAHRVDLDSNFEIKDLHINCNVDTFRINTGSNRLDLYGTIYTYIGSYPGTSYVSGVAGIPGFIAGTIRFKTNVGTRKIFDGITFDANSQTAGWNMEIDFPSGDTAIHYFSTTRCGNLTVLSGILSVEPYNMSSYEIRIAGSDYTAQPGDGTHAGIVTVKSGATMIAARLIKNMPTSAANGLANFVVESGATFIPTLATELVPTQAYTISGDVVLDRSYNQTFIGHGSNVDAINIQNYTNVTIGGTGNKTLVTNTVIGGELKITSSATLAKSTYSLTYGSGSDLHYTVSRVKGSELVAAGSGSAIPEDLIIDSGYTLDLGGATVNIRGALTGSVSNGTVNQFQP